MDFVSECGFLPTRLAARYILKVLRRHGCPPPDYATRGSDGSLIYNWTAQGQGMGRYIAYDHPIGANPRILLWDCNTQNMKMRIHGPLDPTDAASLLCSALTHPDLHHQPL